jgi:hypothetical protein
MSDKKLTKMLGDWVDQLQPIINEYVDGGEPLSPAEVERLALIIRFKIDVNQGNISVEDMEKALDESSIYNNTLH